MLYNFFSDNFEYDECNAKGSCSIPPSVFALQEVLLICLKQFAYYIIELKKLGEDCACEERLVIETLSTIVSTTDYSDEQHLNIISNVYYNIIKSRKKYLDICKHKGLESRELKSILNITPQMNLSQIMSLGEKAFLNKYKKTSQVQKNMTDILIAVIKSTASNLSKLLNYSVVFDDVKDEILKGLNLLNKTRLPLSTCKTQIKKLAHFDKVLTEKLSEEQFKSFGEIDAVEVSYSTEKGKAILVSGECLQDLENILQSVSNTDIDVYTHDELLIAHSFEKFKAYKNLKGHYGTCTENCVLDFATFPGSILLTRNSNINIEHLYRGRLFTTSSMLPKGVVAVKDEGFSDVIKSAQSAKGFAKGHSKNSEVVGYNPSTLEREFEVLAENFKNSNTSRVIIIGLSAFRQCQKDYFNEFMANLPDDAYVISFSFGYNRKNFMHINVANNRPLVYSVLIKLFDFIPITSERLAFFVTRCDVTSISSMINLKEKGAKNVFLTQCPPNVINPAILASLDSVYGIKTALNAKNDLNEILG